jgi:HD-GYP domain-containing protein (c-di-GMP phosphodiesterase class II)
MAAAIGLKEEEIPLSARIFAIVDVWDALSFDRPYRKAWAQEKVAAYIAQQAGKHFDPQIVPRFFELVGPLSGNHYPDASGARDPSSTSL